MAWTTIPTHVTGDVLPAGDWNAIGADLVFLHDKGADLASAATITPTQQFHKVTGTVTITTIAVTNMLAGSRVLLWFASGGCQVTHSTQIGLSRGDFISGPGDTLELISD